MGEIKITRELLDGYRKRKREIPLLEAELEDMRKTDDGLGSSVILDYRKGYPQPQAVTGFDWERYERRRRALERKKEECRAVEVWIGDIEDAQARSVFRMYYLEGLSWLKIAARIGCPQNEDYPRICIRDAWMKKMKIL